MVEFDHFSIIFAPLLNHCMPFRFHFFCLLTPPGYFSLNSPFALSVFQTLVTCPDRNRNKNSCRDRLRKVRAAQPGKVFPDLPNGNHFAARNLFHCPVIVYERGKIQPVFPVFLNAFPIRNRLKRNETVLRIPGAVRTIFFSCPDQFIDLLCLDFLPLAKIPEDKPISK